MSDIRITDKVRSFDFDCKDLTGPNACYVEGYVTGGYSDTHNMMGRPCYEVLVCRQVFGGKEVDALIDQKVYPPKNGIPTARGGVTSFVEKIGMFD